MSTLCIATRGYLNNTLAIASRGYLCDEDDFVGGSGGYYRKGYTILSDEEERELLGVYDKDIKSEIKAPKKKERKPDAVKIGSYSQTKPYEQYTLREAEDALNLLNFELDQAPDDDICLQILIHIRCLEDICKQIRERDIVFIMALLNA